MKISGEEAPVGQTGATGSDFFNKHGNYSTPIKFSYAERVDDKHPRQYGPMSWQDFATWIASPEGRSTAKGGRYICGPMQQDEPRGKAAALPSTWVAFDFDRLTPEQADSLPVFIGGMWQSLGYPTASSTPEAPRYRVIIALNREAKPEDCKRVCESVGAFLKQALGVVRDTCQDRTSQPLYLPLDGAPVSQSFDGVPPLDVDYWLAQCPPATSDELPHTGPVPDWSGMEDDNELIARALKSQSTRAMFGGSATFAQLWEAEPDALARYFPAGDRADGLTYDASAADAALFSHLAFWTGRNAERMLRIAEHSALRRDKWTRDDYLKRTIGAILSKPGDVYIDEAARRRDQIEEAMRIGDGCDKIRLAGSIELEEMVERFVYIEDGQQVVDLKQPQHPKLLADFKAAMKSSKTTVEVKGEFNRDGTPKTKSCETTKLWEQSPGRQIAQAVTFKAGGLRVVPDPKGREAINTWNLPKRSTPAGDASLFLEHVDYLFGEDSGLFLNWLAHIEQKPGELPQTGWLHISERQGTGRNWLASVLARLWPGYAAVNFDLAGCLRTGFNDRLSSKLIAIVDEINEGANDSKWRNAETLKSLLNESQRTINPKFGRIREEYNACRWLIFSNHRSALALNETDRRVNVVLNEAEPLTPEYYTRLYAALKDSSFIAGVAKLLSDRDLSEFNPGAHAVRNAAKETVACGLSRKTRQPRSVERAAARSVSS